MLEQLEAKEAELLEELAEVRAAIKEERLLLAARDYGVRVGSVVMNKNGGVFRVTRVVPWNGGAPWLEGNPKKKDGTFGTARRNLYGNWTLVSV